ncbi:MAG: hypothetical protein WC009_07815 [Methylotenera sp.]
MSKTTKTTADTTVLEILRATYQTIYISAVNAGKEIGMAPGTTRNMLTEGRFPIPTLKIGAKRVVSIFVLADFVMQRSQLPVQARKGARTKAERLKEQGRV